MNETCIPGKDPVIEIDPKYFDYEADSPILVREMMRVTKVGSLFTNVKRKGFT